METAGAQASDRVTRPKFELFKKIVVKDIPKFKQVCMKYYFKDCDNNEEPRALIFVRLTEVFELDIHTEQVTTIYAFRCPLNK